MKVSTRGERINFGLLDCGDVFVDLECEGNVFIKTFPLRVGENVWNAVNVRTGELGFFYGEFKVIPKYEAELILN